MIKLTTRQVKVLELMVNGESNLDIAAKLGLSVKTVEFHLTRIYKRLGVSGRDELLRRAL